MNKYIIHIVSHTHWDREWYLPYETMRLRLVDMMDTLLGIMDSDSDYRYFTLDGQTVVLEDYLEIRPEMREKLREYIREGRIFVGPWYTLPDEFLVSGESLIRNLLFGYRIALDFERVIKIGYLPDMFGHISQLPQILCGFGISTAVLWRGIGGEGAEYILQGPDGSKVFLCRLEPERGYSNGHDILRQGSLPDLIAFKEKEAKRSKTRHLLLMNGSDHRFPDPHLSSILHKLNASLDDVEIIQSNLWEYINAVKREAKGIDTLYGEQRSGLKFAPILPGVLSSRVYLKQKNEAMQILLERWVELFSSINWLCGGNYKKEVIRQAWKYLLQNHAHDSVCGCSIDEVQLDMERRLSRVEEIGKRVLSESLNGVVQNMNIPAQSIVVFNPLNWERGGWVNASIEFENGEEFILTDGENAVPYKIISKRYINEVVLSPQIHIKKRVKIRIAFEANAVPAVGYKTYIIKKGKMFFPSQIQSGDNWAENENLRVEIEKDGTLTILDKNTNEVYEGLGYFEDSGDSGDEYNYSPTLGSSSLSSLGTEAEVEKEEGPFFVRFKVNRKFRIPEGLTKRRSRSGKMVNLEIESLITLLAMSRRVDIETTVVNKAKNHRLRVMFPTGIKSSSFVTFSKFDCIKRKIKDLPTAEDWVEKPTGTFPYDNFIDISSGKRGLAILADGVKEGELVDGSIIALMLLRCVGDLSKDDLATRRGHAGPAVSTPGAQCSGIYRFRELSRYEPVI